MQLLLLTTTICDPRKPHDRGGVHDVILVSTIRKPFDLLTEGLSFEKCRALGGDVLHNFYRAVHHFNFGNASLGRLTCGSSDAVEWVE
jgi:hypothetical protein